MQIKVQRVDWEFTTVFRIAYQQQTHAETVVVEVTDGPHSGRGEAMGVSYHGETAATMIDQLAHFCGARPNGVSRSELQAALPAGGARNALDCALWDLETKKTERRAWELAGIAVAKPLITAYTLGLDALDVTVRAASEARQYSRLKIKLSGEGDLERVARVRAARPDADIIVDANQSWNEQLLRELTPQLATLGVKLIEQPLPVGRDEVLSGFVSAVPLCADESCQTADSLAALRGKYQYINIKLDKTGGLTEAMRVARLAKNLGFHLMVGCMGGSSLAMAPAFIVGQLCDFIDLDGPLLLKTDVEQAIRYEGSLMEAPGPQLWG